MDDILFDLFDKIKYDILKFAPPKISQIPTEISIDIHYDKKNKVHWVDSPNLEGFIASSDNEQDLPQEIHDTLLSYFDVPRHFANKDRKPGLIKKSDGTIIGKSQIKSDSKYKYAPV